jgi:hypothetical protein
VTLLIEEDSKLLAKVKRSFCLMSNSFLKSPLNWLVKVHEDLDPKPLDPWLEEQQVLSRNRIQEEEEQRRLESEEPQSRPACWTSSQ